MRNFLISFATFCSLAHVCFATLYDGDKDVITFKKYSEFEKTVVQGSGVWMVAFFTPSCMKSNKMIKEYKRVAEVSRGIMNIGAVDMSTEAGQLIGAAHEVDSYPTILIFGDDKHPTTYGGQLKAQSMFNEILELMMETLERRAAPPDSGEGHHPGGVESKVIILKSSNYKQEILDNPLVSAVAFTSPVCEHCKKLRPFWEEAARTVDRDGGIFGWIDATEETELAKIYGVEGYPAIFIFPGGANKTHANATRYHGGRNAVDLTRQVFAEVDKTGARKQIPELTSAAEMEEHCSGEEHICILAALPHIMESGADRRNKYTDLISTVSRTFRGRSVSFLWFEGASQPVLEKTFGLSFGYPAVIAYYLEADAYQVMKGPFSEGAITKFVERNENWRKRSLIDLSEMPTVITTEPWDGQDESSIDEDEIPLSDIMGDEL